MIISIIIVISVGFSRNSAWAPEPHLEDTLFLPFSCLEITLFQWNPGLWFPHPAPPSCISPLPFRSASITQRAPAGSGRWGIPGWPDWQS